MTAKIYLCIMLLALSWSAFAQKDTTFQTIREEVGAYTAPVIETSMDHLFQTKMPSKWMFKLGFTEFLNFGNLSPTAFQNFAGLPLLLGVEHKLLPAFSIGAYYGLSFNSQFEDDLTKGTREIFSSTITLEGRWYHDMQRRIREGRSANNFGGKYVAVQANWFNIYASKIGQIGEGQRVSLRYGWQHRNKHRVYFDLNGGIGFFNRLDAFRQAPIISTDQRFSIGLAALLPKIRSEVPKDAACDVTRCFDDQYKMLKINLFKVLDFGFSNDLYSIRLTPSVVYEQKIGSSPFSIEFDAAFRYNNSKSLIRSLNNFIYGPPYLTQSTNANLNIGGELHWYPGMRKRVVTGRSGNNLSGFFLGMRLHRNDRLKNAYYFASEDPRFAKENVVLDGDYWASNFVIGLQRRLLDRGYFQFKIAPGATFGGHNYLRKDPDTPLTKISRNNEFNDASSFKIGFFF